MAAVLTRVKALLLWYTLFVFPFSGPITLTSEGQGTGLTPLDYIAHAGNMEAKEENIMIVSGHR